MRSIVQGSDPAKLRQWKRKNSAHPQNLTYANMPACVKDQLKLKLLEEQGGICAYTMCRIPDVDSFHIEHIEPQNAKPDKAIEYSNMAACFPKDGGDTSYEYGAPIKGGKEVEINVNFVTPHSQGCEGRFHFDSDGKIHATSNDAAADSTIKILGLDNPILNELRLAALAAHGLILNQRSLRTRPPHLTSKEASRLANRVLKPLSGRKQLEPFCVAIAEVAKSYAEKERARGKRMQKQKNR